MDKQEYATYNRRRRWNKIVLIGSALVFLGFFILFMANGEGARRSIIAFFPAGIFWTVFSLPRIFRFIIGNEPWIAESSTGDPKPALTQRIKENLRSNKKFHLAIEIVVGVMVVFFLVGSLAPTPDVEGPFVWNQATNELSVDGLTVVVPGATLRTPAEEYGGGTFSSRRADRVGLGWQTLTPWDESVVTRGPLANMHVKHAVAYLAVPNGSFAIRVGAGILYDETQVSAGPNSAFDGIERGRFDATQIAKYEQTTGSRKCFVDYSSYRPGRTANPLSQGFILVDDPALPPLVFFVGGASGKQTDLVFADLLEQICGPAPQSPQEG